MKLVPIFVLVVLWVESSSSPVKTDPGIVSTLSNSARYVGKKLHIIKKRQTSSAGDGRLGKVDSESEELKTNDGLMLESGSKYQNQTNETEISNRTKRAQGSDDPRYILVHDVPPCKKRRSVEDYEQLLPACSTQGGKNITIIIQNFMDETEKHQLTRGAETYEGNGRNASKLEEETPEIDQVQDFKVSEASERVAVDDPRSVEEANLSNDAMETGESPTGRKLLWGLEEASPLLDNVHQSDPFLFNFLHASEQIDKSLSEQQQDFKAEQKQDENAEVEVEKISHVASHAFCVCRVINMKCGSCVNAFRVWEQSDTVNCTRACSELVDCCCEVKRANPIKSTDDDVSASERVKRLDQALHLEVAWIIILMLNILVGINTIVIGYVCWKGPNKKKSVFLVHGYANIPPARA